ncbi:MAG: UDP-N-acetylmuramate dehydrogenase [Alphaproteobacteria bacterium]|nr:UDP-N-acetylmuramate dehydrogenase [Alphaproteobacteria bacterium]
MTTLQQQLPKVRGAYRFDAPLAKTNWFGVGGAAEVVFRPEDAADLAHFMREIAKINASSPSSPPQGARMEPIPVTVIGVGSNLIVRDGGIRGVVIRLGRFFNTVTLDGDTVVAGAAMLDLNLAQAAAGMGRAGLEFMSGIPGTLGGALAMNAGAYGREVKDVLIKAEAVTHAGEVVELSLADMRYGYRHYGGPEGLIFTRGWFATTRDDPAAIHARIAEIQEKRAATQPIRERTGGSTFRNPEGHKAWELIDAAGCRGLTVGGAQMSPLHCNFMINTGGATAADLEALGEEVRARVKAHSGVELHWEIKRLGEAL